ncbi:adenine phosphoribosyltransferase [Ureaplasma ceti]|uniref:Adenine phosphoribosyltransferase n=1 Tax=Ureaplasma ceti TaxID=3119530 RepID=A0ABP9U658_9BACT
MKDLKKLESQILTVKDYPKPGVMFKDITPLFLEPEMINEIIDDFAEFANQLDVDVILGAESRGFLFGVPLSLKLNKPFVLVRKPNKLPREVYAQSYDLEYGSSTVEMHKDALKPGQKALIIDDLLATGGTVEAIEKLVKQAGGVVAGSAFLIELVDLHGKDRLAGKVHSILKY